MSYSLQPAIPILRIFDVGKALDFYLGYLGFEEDWLHQPEDNLPSYRQVSRERMKLHLSEHYGDSVPGIRLFIPIEDIKGFWAELAAKDFQFANPNLESVSWGQEVTVTDPFGNRLTFCHQQME